MSKNRITGGEGFWIVFISIIFFAVYPKIFMAIAVLLILVAIILLANIYANLPICPSCKNKSKLIFLHRRIDGGPDRRYKYNPLVCSYCGASPHVVVNSMQLDNVIKADLQISACPSSNNQDEVSNSVPETPQELELARSAKLQARNLESHRRMNILRESWGKAKNEK